MVFDKCTTLLYDSVEDKVHELKHPELDLSKLCVLASCSNWLLIGDLRLNFCLLNVFTREKIDLPSLKLSDIGEEEDEDSDKWYHLIEGRDMSKKSAVLWTDERTRDYVVAWVYKRRFLFTYKNGDEMWVRNLEDTKCDHMVFKDNKIYTNVESKKWERVDSIGDDEMLIFGHGVTVRTCINGGSIYFSQDDLRLDKSQCGVFDLATSTITWAKEVGSSLLESRWFVPGEP